MKKIYTIIFFIVWSSIFAQKTAIDPAMIQMGWTFASPMILKKINDPLTKEIISKAIPKIINQDAKGATLEVTDAIYRVKHIKVANKEFLSQLEKNINQGISAIQKQDYVTAVNGLITTVSSTEAYFKNGILDEPDTKSQTPASVVKTDLITKSEINSKLHLGKNNDYLFFIPAGTITDQNKNTSNPGESAQSEDFNIRLDDGKKYNLEVAEESSNNFKNVSVDEFESNKELNEKFKSGISGALATNLGQGQIIKSEINNYNFKALKYTYSYIDKGASASSMAYVLVAFHNTTMFMIVFTTPAEDFPETKKSFADLMENFYIIGVDEIANNNNTPTPAKLDCETKKVGLLTIVNKSTNPYIIYKNGDYLMEIQGGGVTQNINVELGTTDFKAEQKIGFAFSPTINNRIVNFTASCQTLTINIGFLD